MHRGTKVRHYATFLLTTLLLHSEGLDKMSIIYDALKKAEGNNGQQLPSQQQFLNKQNKNSHKILFTIGIIVLLAAAFVSINYFFATSEAVNDTKQQTIIPANKESATTPSERRKTPKPQPQQLSYNLEGIILGGNNPFAIINGKRVYKNDKVGNYIVLEINKDSVKLSEIETEKTKTLSLSF